MRIRSSFPDSPTIGQSLRFEHSGIEKKDSNFRVLSKKVCSVQSQNGLILSYIRVLISDKAINLCLRILLRSQSQFRLQSSQDWQSICNETQTSYYHKSIGGYHGAKLKGYQELIRLSTFNGSIQFTSTQNVGRFGTAIFQFTPILNMLNTKYCIVDPSKAALVNNSVQGNAWYVSNVKHGQKCQ